MPPKSNICSLNIENNGKVVSKGEIPHLRMILLKNNNFYTGEKIFSILSGYTCQC